MFGAGGAAALGGAALIAGLAATSLQPKPESAAIDKPASLERKAIEAYSFAPVVKRVAPSVVKVNTVVKSKAAPMMDDESDSWLRRFFGEDPRGRRNFRTPSQRGQGSGVIVTKDGFILTNNHVVDGADEVRVSLQDGREFTAKVVGRDPKTDVAVLKVEAKDLPYLEMANSDQIEVGDLVLAVGNPFGIGQTVTMGMVSATGRATLGLDYEDFIQTDAAINPGNSGGALVDADGRLIGINTAILSRSGGNQGIGFAIPVNLAHDIMESLVKDGKVTRGYLGAIIQDITPSLAKEFNLKDTKGALIGDVVPKGPGDKAGLKSGDVVTEFNGKPVTSSRQLRLTVARSKPDKSVPVKILRDGTTKTLTVTLKELPGQDAIAKASDKARTDEGTLNGVTVADLDARARRQFNVPADIQGALVTDVEEDSAAAEAGVKPGDVILEINRTRVRNSEEAVKLTENPKDKTSLLRIWSQGGTHYLVVDESKTS
jgi:serine protease Do